MSLTSYKELIVWQKSFQLCLEIYRLGRKFPKHELYILVSQMYRAVISIPSNIAEGYTRRSRQEYAHFISIAFASGAELETQILLAHELNYISLDDFNKVSALLGEVMRMLNTLYIKLKHPNG